MKWISPVVVLLLGIAIIFLSAPTSPSPNAAPGIDPPPVAVCAVNESSSRTTKVAVASTVAGPGELTVFAGGSAVGSAPFATGTSGSSTIPIFDISAVGKAGALIEFPTADSAAATVSAGAEAVAAEVCSRVPNRQVVIGGATTIEDRQLEIQLMNPYSAEAVVDIVATSESGRESNDGLNTITVPPQTSILVDIDSLLPGRESLVLVVQASRGSVVAVAREEKHDDSAVWRAVAPSENWLVAIPTYAGLREVIIASSAPADVEYQIDVYGPEGLEVEAIDGVITGGSQNVIDVSTISPGAVALRVVATSPIGVFSRFSTPTGLALTTGSPAEAAEWLLPGAGSIPGIGRVVMVNVGLEAAEVTVAELREISNSNVIIVQPAQVIEVPLDGNLSDGVSLLSDGLIVPMWISETPTAVAASAGAPLGNE